MEGSEELSSLKPQTPDEQHHHQQQQGLGFQSSPPDPNLDHPPTNDNLQQIVSQEFQNLALKEATDEEERELKRSIDDELYTLAINQALNEALQAESLNQAVDEDIATIQANSEALRRFIDEALESRDKETDHQEDAKAESEYEPKNTPVFEENERNEQGSGHEVDEIDNCEDKRSEHENEDGNGWGEVWDKDGVDNNEDNRSENDDEDEEGYNLNVDENMGGESGAVAVSKDEKHRRYYYPLRPDAEDCSYYLRTGMCKFGSNCKFNHPHRRRNQAAKETVKQKEENLERPGQTECKYYLTSGGCKFGKACRYNHSRGKTAAAAGAPIVEFNFLGLPIRLGERECPYYMRNGSCKYGSNCRFNHPDPTTVGGGDPLSGYGNGGSVSVQGASQTTMSSWSSPRTLNEPASFVPVRYSPTQPVPSPNPEWNGYQAPVYPTSERSLPTPPAIAFAMNNPATDTNFYTHSQQQMLVEEFPERPGQPECSYFLKTGDCKYRSSCKFHHPKSRIPKTSACVLSDKGLPLRPDQNICSHYSRYGICKFGPGCKFDHPVNYSNSASSAGYLPDQLPPFGNLVTADGARMAGSL